MKLTTALILLCAVAQLNATMMQYNTSNQVIKSDKQTMSYGPKGYLASVDDVHLIRGGVGVFIEQEGLIASTVFGGVRLLSNGVAQSIFTDNQSTLKSASSNKVQYSYTDPYGNANATPKTKGESYPLLHNRMTYDGGYQINGDLINFNARSYMPSIKRFTSNDSYDVPNRYNFSDGNPVMKFDPSGHNAQSLLNFTGNILIGIPMGDILLGTKKERDAAFRTSLNWAFGLAVATGVAIFVISKVMNEGYRARNAIAEIERKAARRAEKKTLITDMLRAPRVGDSESKTRSLGFRILARDLYTCGTAPEREQRALGALKSVFKWLNKLFTEGEREELVHEHITQSIINYGGRPNDALTVGRELAKFLALQESVLGSRTPSGFRLDFYSRFSRANPPQQLIDYFLGKEARTRVVTPSPLSPISMSEFHSREVLEGHFVTDRSGRLISNGEGHFHFHGYRRGELNNWLNESRSRWLNSEGGNVRPTCPNCRTTLTRADLSRAIFVGIID